VGFVFDFGVVVLDGIVYVDVFVWILLSSLNWYGLVVGVMGIGKIKML